MTDINTELMNQDIANELFNAGLITEATTDQWSKTLGGYTGNSECMRGVNAETYPSLEDDLSLRDKFCAPLESLTRVFGGRRRRRRKSRKSRKSRRKSRKTKRKRRKSRKTKRKRRKSRK